MNVTRVNKSRKNEKKKEQKKINNVVIKICQKKEMDRA